MSAIPTPISEQVKQQLEAIFRELASGVQNMDISDARLSLCLTSVFQLERALTNAQGQVHQLMLWKEAQLYVESQWEPQRVAKLLGVPLGEDIRVSIEPRIVALKAELDAANEGADMLATCVENSLSILVNCNWDPLRENEALAFHKARTEEAGA